jgi:lambda family phage portal protein
MSFGVGGASSADAELNTSLYMLRSRSRQMVRDSAYAKRARTIIVNNVVGSGVGMQAQVLGVRGELNTRVNDDIEAAWREWCAASSCHTGGALAFGDLERALIGEVFEAGEVLVRMHFRTFGDSRIPLALELVEAERLADTIDTGFASPGNECRMGVEVDRFQRPVAYWIRGRHRGDIRLGSYEGSENIERVPASDVFHLKLTTRWPQTRGEPWLHTVLRKLDDMNEYTGAEVQAARAGAYYFATVTKPDDGQNPIATSEEASTGQPLLDLEPLTVQELAPGETLQFHTPNRPNAAVDPFLRYMLREVAAGAGVSYESLSRDYSQSNYSSSRLALLDDRDSYKALQQWWIRSFRLPLHRLWLRQAVLSRAVASIPVEAYASDARRYEAVLMKPRGWSWVDPTKEVNAYKEAVKSGFITVTDVIAATAGGMDVEDVIGVRQRELEMFAEAGIELDTTVPAPAAAVAPAAPDPAEPEDDEDEAAERRLRRIA